MLHTETPMQNDLSGFNAAWFRLQGQLLVLALIIFSGSLLNTAAANGHPTTTISQPARHSLVSYPVMIAGTISSSTALDRIDLLIRSEDGRYWNGNTFQVNWIPVSASWSGSAWQYIFDANITGSFSVTSRAWNTAGVKQTVASYLPFKAVSTNEPLLATIDYPGHKDVARSPVKIAGTINNPATVSQVQLVIRNPDKQFWNGVSYQSDWHAVNASVTDNQWSYAFAPDIASKAYVRVKAVDLDGTRQNPPAAVSFATLLPDNTPPESTITYPSHRSVVQYPLVITGLATDNETVSNVDLVIKDTHSGHFWNGSNFQQAWTQVSADISGANWTYELDADTNHKISIKAIATDSSNNRQPQATTLIAEMLACSHLVTGTATPANSGTPTVIDSEAISYTTGTVISANFFNSGAIIDRQGRTVSVCVTEPDGYNNRRAQILTDVGQTDNTAIKAYPEFIIGSKFGLVDETSYRPYPLQISSTGFKYPDLENIAGLTGLPAHTSDLPDIDIVLNIDEQNVVGAERDVMLESWFYDLSANTGLLGTDSAGNPLDGTLNNIVGDGHPNPSLMNLSLEMMVHVGALSPNDISGATRNPSQHRLTQSPVTIGNYQYHIWYGDTHLAPLVVYSRETDINGNFSMDLTREGNIFLDWNLFLDYTLNDLEARLAQQDVDWATGASNIFPALRATGAVGAVEFGVEPQTNNALDKPYRATINKLDVKINGQQFGFK